jgi:hypothetical protein
LPGMINSGKTDFAFCGGLGYTSGGVFRFGAGEIASRNRNAAEFIAMKRCILLFGRYLTFFWAGFGILWYSGCATPVEKMQKRLETIQDKQLFSVLNQSLEASGGLEKWANMCRIEGDVIVTVFDADGGKTLIEQQQVIRPVFKRGVMVSSVEPEGTLLEQLEEGVVRVVRQGGEKPLPEKDKEVLLGSAIKLVLLSHAVSGAICLVPEKDVTISYLGLERQGGRMNHKIEVAGLFYEREDLLTSTTPDKLVVWINTETNLIERLWIRYPKDGDKGDYGFLAVNVDKYIKTAEGVVLPSYLEFVQSDQYQQFSQRQYLAVEYLRLRANEREKSWNPFNGRK